MVRRSLAVLVLLLFVSVPAFAAAREGGSIPVQLPLFPSNNWWNTDISNAPTVANSTIFYPFMGGSGRALHPDFGGDAGGGDTYGFPFLIVDGTQPLKTVTFDISDESDGVDHNTDQSFPFYPIPDEAATMFGWVEGGQPGNVDQRADADRHMLIVDKTNNRLFELYNVWFNGANWEAGSGAFFDLTKNDRRTETWTSADASGMALLPGLVRYDEVFNPAVLEINHAFRVTVSSTNGHIFPASHTAGGTAGALPMGARLRLKAGTNILGFTQEMQKIFRAFKKYGLIVADNGSNMYISGTYDTRWNNDVLNPAFGALHTSDFEVIQLGWQPATSLQIDMPAYTPVGATVSATITARNISYNPSTTYAGTVHFTSNPSAAVVLPADFTYTAGTASHLFNNLSFPTAGLYTITVTDTVVSSPITASRTIVVGPGVPTGVVATATSPTSVNVSWDAAPGATQYEVVRQPAFVSVVKLAATTFNDSTVTAGNVYVYRVRAFDAANMSGDSIPDVATTFVFTDDPLIAGTTAVKPVHITELRQMVNKLRTVAGLGAMTFTDATLNSSVQIKVDHLQEVQDALDFVRRSVTLSLVPNSYHTATYDTDTFVQADNIRELRNGFK